MFLIVFLAILTLVFTLLWRASSKVPEVKEESTGILSGSAPGTLIRIAIQFFGG